MGKMRERVPLRRTPFIRNRFVTTGKGYGLERTERHNARIVEGKLDDAPNLLIVDAVDDCRNWNNINASGIQVLDCLQLHVEQVSDFPMGVGCVSDSIKLQIGVTQSSFRSLLAELFALCEFDSIGRRLYARIAHLARIGDCIQEVWRKCWLTARELHRHLPLRLERNGIVEQSLDLFPSQLVNEANLVGVHEAGI